MKDFEKRLYEALLVAFGKVIAQYNGFAQASILRDVGREILDYLDRHGFDFREENNVSDLGRLTELFVQNGFASKVEVEPAERGSKYLWHDLYGREAYRELHELSDNPFLACPLNLCLYYIADKHGKTMRLHSKSFDRADGVVESQYEVVDKEALPSDAVDGLVVENARLCAIAEERARRLEKAQSELRILRGILPICSCCKKIRTDEGHWQKLEVYVRDHSEAEFTHSYCPECAEKAMREFDRSAERRAT
jgi:hypothetical protein